MSYAGLRVLVLGLGRSGRAAAGLLAREGARLAVYDRDPTRLAALELDAERLGGREPPAFEGFDRVVTSPGLRLEPHPDLVPEVDLAAEHLRAALIGVTGTNGKSTTAVLIGEMLSADGRSVAVGGNLGTPLSALVDAPVDWVVAELSSFQLEHARVLRARVAALLNLAPDHLDRHGSLEAYGAAKARLAELQHPDDTLVFNADDAWARGVAGRAPARGAPFSTRGPLEHGAGVEGGALTLRAAGRELLRVALADLAPACRVPLGNALGAAAAAHAAGVAVAAIEASLRSFAGLAHRAELVCTRRGVRYVDDSKATNPSAAAACLEAQDGAIWWLLGGRNKGLDFGPLARAAARARGAIVFGEAASELAEALRGATEVVSAATLEAAVRAAAARAVRDDVVLLSPACASFDEFASFEERGERFATLARSLPC